MPFEFGYACIAAAGHGGRCRNMAVRPPEVLFCSRHSDKSPTAPVPDRVFVKIRVNERWRDSLKNAGLHIVRRTPEKEAELEQRHTEHAESVGRQAHVIRQVADSGVPVFDKNGIQFIGLCQLHGELTKAGYQRVGGHVLEKATTGGFVMLTLVLEYSQTASNNSTPIPPAAQPVIARLLATRRWGFTHVWANPPDADGKIVHTVNASHREDDKPAIGNLIFMDGFWMVDVAVDRLRQTKVLQKL